MIENVTIPMLEPLINLVTVGVGYFKVIVGGVFGVYLILIYFRWIEYRALVRIMEDIRKDIRHIAHSQGHKFPNEPKSWYENLKDYFKRKK